jgi:hypothetical protein
MSSTHIVNLNVRNLSEKKIKEKILSKESKEAMKHYTVSSLSPLYTKLLTSEDISLLLVESLDVL